MAYDEAPTSESANVQSRDSLHLLIVGGVSVLVAVAISVSLGRVYSNYELLNLLRGMSSPIHFLSSAVFTALAAILALTLTSVSLLRDLHVERLRTNYLNLIRRIAYWSIVGMGLSLLILLLTIIPSAQEGAAPNIPLVTAIYYGVIGMLSLMVGVVMTLMMMLKDAIEAVLDSLPHEIVRAIETEADSTLASSSSPPHDRASQPRSRGPRLAPDHSTRSSTSQLRR